MRTHIAKSLQTRCKAIQNALKAYNTAALELNPPRPMLEWSKVSHYEFLEEFDLLVDTRHDVRDKPWAQPAIRETMKRALRVKRAREEIIECNRGLKRLHTSIRDEKLHFEKTLQKLREEGSVIHEAVEDFVIYRTRVNDHILRRIFQTYDLDDYTGDKVPGIRKGSNIQEPVLTVHDSEQAIHTSTAIPAIPDAHSDESDDDDEVEDSMQGDIGSLVDFMSRLTT
jgi:hypothetical protein